MASVLQSRRMFHGRGLLQDGSGGLTTPDWSYLVGTPSGRAKNQIRKDNLELHLGINIVQIVPPDVLVTTDFREDRVRIFVNDKGFVIQTPTRG